MLFVNVCFSRLKKIRGGRAIIFTAATIMKVFGCIKAILAVFGCAVKAGAASSATGWVMDPHLTIHFQGKRRLGVCLCHGS